jgi:hypothetical protein
MSSEINYVYIRRNTECAALKITREGPLVLLIKVG